MPDSGRNFAFFWTSLVSAAASTSISLVTSRPAGDLRRRRTPAYRPSISLASRTAPAICSAISSAFALFGSPPPSPLPARNGTGAPGLATPGPGASGTVTATVVGYFTDPSGWTVNFRFSASSSACFSFFCGAASSVASPSSAVRIRPHSVCRYW